MISYKKLWKLLIDKGLKKKDLCREAKISAATVTKMGKKGHISTSVIERICLCLNCSPGDIMEFRPEQTSGNTLQD